MITVKTVRPAKGFSIDIISARRRLPLPSSIFLKHITSLLRCEKFSSCQLSIVIVSDLLIRRLNRRFMKKNRPTDVLAFDLGTKKGFLAGDVIVSLDTARRMSHSLGVGAKEEIWRYVVHGILHLAGYDDRTPEKRKKMWRRQEALVSRFLRTLS